MNELAKCDYGKEYYPQIRAVLNAEEAPDSTVETAVEYCRAAGLDIMRKPVAIISYNSKKGIKNEIVFTIQAITTIASRAGWCGSDEIIFSDSTVEVGGKKYPAFGYQVVYKMISGVRCAFTGPKVYLTERHKDKWSMAGVMAMYQKCITAAALRLAFPEQLAHAYEESEIEHETTPEVTIDNSGIEALKATTTKEKVVVKAEDIIEAEEVIETKEEVIEDDLTLMSKLIVDAKDLDELKAAKDAIAAYKPKGNIRKQLLESYTIKEELLKKNAT